MAEVGGSTIRVFDTGATRDADDNKFDYEGFLSPLAIREFASYMHRHRIQSDGKIRASDNWAKGIPISAYIKSLWRHLIALWTIYRGYYAYDEKRNKVELKDELCAIIFNAQGYLHEVLKKEIEAKNAQQN